MQPSILILLVQTFATLYLVGLIWIVQMVHYPLFRLVGETNFIEYQKRHQWLITLVVGPPMLAEAFSAIAMAWFLPAGIEAWMVYVSIALVLTIWVSTACLQVPCHSQLENGFDQKAHRKLVNTNWIRTLAWSLRGVLIIWMLTSVIQNS